MRPFFKFFFLVLALPLFLAACEGGGTKDGGAVAASIQAPAPNAAFVFRDTGFQGSGVLLEVIVDGVAVGKVGVQESFEISVPPGSHTLTVRAQGLGAIGVTYDTVQFTKRSGVPHFFVIGLKQSFLGAKMTVLETTQSSYLSTLRD